MSKHYETSLIHPYSSRAFQQHQRVGWGGVEDWGLGDVKKTKQTKPKDVKKL
jgi:hypothetical protein